MKPDVRETQATKSSADEHPLVRSYHHAQIHAYGYYAADMIGGFRLRFSLTSSARSLDNCTTREQFLPLWLYLDILSCGYYNLVNH